MCGLVGVLSLGSLSDEELLHSSHRMLHALTHRGPDTRGVWIDSSAKLVLGHARLAVQDLSEAGHQPMKSLDSRYVVSFNGEIYNHFEIRHELSSSGLLTGPWRGQSDTETLLAAIQAWGFESTLRRLRGMFAIALWDCRRRILHLARDRFGEKPLYYGMVNHSLVYGSELKPFKKFPHFKNKVSRRSLREFLKYNYVQVKR